MPDLSNNTMLVCISMGMCRQSRQLPEVSAKIEAEAGATPGTIGGTSRYFFKRKEGKKTIDGLATLKKFQNEWRASLRHYARYTYASDVYILPAALVHPFMEENNRYVLFKGAVFDNWAANEWPYWSSSAENRMGKFHDAADFPTLEECRERFTCQVDVMPLAESDKWNRITLLAPALANMMRERQEAAVEKVVKETHKQLWEDVLAPLNNVINQLEKDKTKLHETLIDNVIKICDLVPAYNEVHNDQRLEELAAKAKETFLKIDIELLRQSAAARAQVIEDTKQLLENSGPYSRTIIMCDDEPETEPQQ